MLATKPQMFGRAIQTANESLQSQNVIPSEAKNPATSSNSRSYATYRICSTSKANDPPQ
jgi:hypothetical protein